MKRSSLSGKAESPELGHFYVQKVFRQWNLSGINKTANYEAAFSDELARRQG
jgi:hypothetical protein